MKLTDRSIPIQILKILENWFSSCLSCVKWGSVMSHFYELKAGVRQGAVLSPILFGIYIDVLVHLVKKANIGCKFDSKTESFLETKLQSAPKTGLFLEVCNSRVCSVFYLE